MFSNCLEIWRKRAWTSAGEFCAASLRAGEAGPDHWLGAPTSGCVGAGAVQDHLSPFPRTLHAGAGWQRPAEQRRRGRDAHPRSGRNAAASNSWPVPRERDPNPAACPSATWQERAVRDSAAPWCVKAEAEHECLASS